MGWRIAPFAGIIAAGVTAWNRELSTGWDPLCCLQVWNELVLGLVF